MDHQVCKVSLELQADTFKDAVGSYKSPEYKTSLEQKSLLQRRYVTVSSL